MYLLRVFSHFWEELTLEKQNNIHGHTELSTRLPTIHFLPGDNAYKCKSCLLKILLIIPLNSDWKQNMLRAERLLPKVVNYAHNFFLTEFILAYKSG